MKAAAFFNLSSFQLPSGGKGFVVRCIEDGRYFKLKYPGYKEALTLVNEIRSNRFVREYFALNAEERQHALGLLPGDIRGVAKQQLDRHQDIFEGLREYSAIVRTQGAGEPREFASFVRQHVPEQLQRLVFQESRGLDATSLLEGVAFQIYDGKMQFPSLTSFEQNETATGGI